MVTQNDRVLEVGRLSITGSGGRGIQDEGMAIRALFVLFTVRFVPGTMRMTVHISR
jgi:hypothetical protein